MFGIQGIRKASPSSSSTTSRPGTLIIVLPLQLRQLPDVVSCDDKPKEKGEEHQDGHFRSEKHPVEKFSAREASVSSAGRTDD